MKSSKLEDKELEDIVREVLKVTNYHANLFLESMNELKVTNPELYFESMIIYMIDGLSQLGVEKEIVKKHIDSHLEGYTYFYAKEENGKDINLH